MTEPKYPIPGSMLTQEDIDMGAALIETQEAEWAARSELENLKKEVPALKEAAYRLGYSQGYLAARHDVLGLARNGFARLTEVSNILLDHALGAVMAWRNALDMRNSDCQPPPKLNKPDWVLLRHQTFARDGRACTACGSTRYLEIDHIKGVAEGGLPTLDNLRVLCRTCNRARRRPRSGGAA